MILDNAIIAIHVPSILLDFRECDVPRVKITTCAWNALSRVNSPQRLPPPQPVPLPLTILPIILTASWNTWTFPFLTQIGQQMRNCCWLRDWKALAWEIGNKFLNISELKLPHKSVSIIKRCMLTALLGQIQPQLLPSPLLPTFNLHVDPLIT